MSELAGAALDMAVRKVAPRLVSALIEELALVDGVKVRDLATILNENDGFIAVAVQYVVANDERFRLDPERRMIVRA